MMKENKKRQSRFSYKISSELEYVRHFAKVATGECVNNSFELSDKNVIHTGSVRSTKKNVYMQEKRTIIRKKINIYLLYYSVVMRERR